MDKEIAVKAEHISMHFNMSSEKIESIKDYFIKMVKRELFFKDFTALKDVSFEVKKGEVFGIVGTNGSGKSTLLKIISGILSPTQGSVSVNGKIAPLIELGAGFDGDLTARENIFLNGAVLGFEKEFIEEKFTSIVDFAQLWDFLDMPIKNYSSGMVARIAFAIATVVKPEVLIIDEILAVGDFMFQQKCEQRIRDLMSEGTTVVIVSHSLDQIESLCDRVLWIEKGVVRKMGNTFEVCTAYRRMQNEESDRYRKKYQTVSHEKCSICGNTADFRDEPGMTFKTEAFCACCGASLRVSDMMGIYLENKFRLKGRSLFEEKALFEELYLFTTSNRGTLHSFFSGCGHYWTMEGDFSKRCRQLETDDFYQTLPDGLDVVCLEEMLICMHDPLYVLKKFAGRMKKGAVMLATLQMHEGRKTQLNKKMKHKVYWNGCRIVNQWGDEDVLDIFYEAGFSAEKFRSHKWYEKDEILSYGEEYDKLVAVHPFYFYKFNIWVIYAVKN